MKLAFTFVISILLLPALVGSAAAAVAAAPPAAPLAPLFASVHAGGPFPFGQCTWWAAYNHPVSWGGNAADWLANAQAQGVATSDVPAVGAIAVFEPGGAYSALGHVAIVVSVTPDSYTVSEMNAPVWGEVSTRVIAWPDPHVRGFIR